MKNSRARSFTGIIIGIAVSALLLRIAIEKIIERNILQNESNAQITLKSIATAIENYAKDYLGAFPTSLSVLTQHDPPYLGRDYIAKASQKGYNYSCLRLETTGYRCSAVPIKCNLTGKMTYTVTTGGLLVSEECAKKE